MKDIFSDVVLISINRFVRDIDKSGLRCLREGVGRDKEDQLNTNIITKKKKVIILT